MKLSFFIMINLILFSNMVFAQNYQSDTFETKNHGQLTITFIKHASLMINFDNYIIQIDPTSMFADYSTFSKADLILITHEHADHLDAKAIGALTKTNTMLVMNESSYKILGTGKGRIMKNGDKLEVNSKISIEAVPAYNITKGHEDFHPRHRDNGYVLTIDGLRIYISGDTEDIPEMKNLKDIDIAFLPVNQPYSMTVAQAINAAKMISPKVLYPYHFGKTDVKQIQEGLKNSGIEVRLREMQ